MGVSGVVGGMEPRDPGDMVVTLDVKKFVEAYELATATAWGIAEIRKEEVETARKLKQWYGAVRKREWTRAEHLGRIAYLMEAGWTDAIEVDVGVPSMGFTPVCPVLDGNHRLLAAYFRGDIGITASTSGEIRIIKAFTLEVRRT